MCNWMEEYFLLQQMWIIGLVSSVIFFFSEVLGSVLESESIKSAGIIQTKNAVHEYSHWAECTLIAIWSCGSYAALQKALGNT